MTARAKRGPARIGVGATVRVRVFPVVDEIVERGIRCGWRRAHKHVDDPDEESTIEAIRQAVMNELCELFDFDEPIHEDP